MGKLLTRDQFRNNCLNRDNNKCVICGETRNIVVHHILERKLFLDEGYYLDNGASLCIDCHLKAEMTILSVEEIRKACGITKKVLPEHFYADQIYDKWGNPVLENGKRLRGELFDDSSVQKILSIGNVLPLFTKYIKYPRTYHLPWSPGITNDDRVIKNVKYFENKEVIVTVKMDSENTSLYNDYIHARSLSDKKHWSKDYIKNFHSKIAYEIPDDFRLVVENLYAKHSIQYNDLEDYIYGISVWNNLECLSWDDSCIIFKMFNIPTMPIIYRGLWDEKKIRNHVINSETEGGYVVRLAKSFHYKDFRKSVAKYVRANHVQENDHWFYGNTGDINKRKSSNL